MLFSGDMVRAILEGRKTQTRRVYKPRGDCSGTIEINHLPGSRIWVRETWGPCEGGVCYAASELPGVKPDDGKWRPSIFMPRWASRITLEVTEVRMQRLQEINNEDAKAEGIPHAAPHRHGSMGIVREWHPGQITPDPYAKRHNTGINDCWICAFRDLWNSINGPGAWEKDPWVWAYTFKQID